MGPWLKAEADVLLTAGLLGGMLFRFREGRLSTTRVYPSVPSRAEVDPVGAGDTMLAGVMAARIAGGPDIAVRGHDLHVGAAAASYLVEGHGIESVPWLAQLHERLTPSG